ncbi:MAG TPA: hypothetical protein VEB43_09110 [Anaeromyxobacter sp.]|nr:hypothetical protein [Anaeromyxobacter sp.]
MRRWGVVLAAVAMAACNGGGGDDDDGDPTGDAVLTVDGGNPLNANNFAAVTQTATCGVEEVDVGVAYVALIASDQGGICGYLQRNEDKASARSINVVILRVDRERATTTIEPDTYPIVPDPTGLESEVSFLWVSSNDAACNSDDDGATGGTVTVTSTSGGRLRGTVDATLESGARVTGSFDAPSCAVTFPGDVCQGEIGPQDPTCAP